MKKTTLFILLLMFLALRQLNAQGQPTIQDCLGAIPVCQQIYTEDLSPSGDGNVNNEINAAISCTAGELNSIWYTFTVDNTGDFGFVITPNNPNDDYDWALFNITDASCDDIFTDPSLVVSCNAAGGTGCHGPTGATGDSPYDEQGAGCNAPTPSQFSGNSPFNDLIPVQAGNTYALMVSNWTGSTFGYTIDFGLSAGTGVFDETPPQVEEMTPPDACFETEFELVFDEFIQCSTISSDLFNLIGPGGPFTFTLSSDDCDIGGQFENTFTLNVSPPISGLGNYTLEISADGVNDILDLCGNPLQPTNIDFMVDQPLSLSVDLGNDTTVLCLGDTLNLSAENPAATYLWQDGSENPDFTVDSPGVYAVEVTNACGVVTDSIGVEYLQEPPVIDLGPNTHICEGDEIILDASSPFASYEWQNGDTTNTLTVTQGGNYSVVVTNVCGTTTDEILLTFIEAVDLDLGPDRSLCEGDTLVLDATNPNATYEWQNGQSSSTFTVTETGTYAVTVSTICEEMSDEVFLFFIDENPVDLGQDTVLCPGDVIVLDAALPGASYQWQDGSTKSDFTVSAEGTYAVTVTTDCNVFEDERTLVYLPPIEFDLGEDQFLCAPQVFLDASTPGVANYLWNDGSNQPTLLAGAPGVYSVNVFNQCESITDEILLKECESCQVYFPNVFSPDFDGINDEFMPYSDCPFEQFRMQIFDRWGNLMYETTDPTAGWDGTANGKRANVGAYVWWMEFTVIENDLPRTEIASGDVIVVK